MACVIEHFMRTLKEQCLYLHRFQTLAEACRIIGEFITRYNTEWLIERLGQQTPAGARGRVRPTKAQHHPPRMAVGDYSQSHRLRRSRFSASNR
jgi:hypothetical protein